MSFIFTITANKSGFKGCEHGLNEESRNNIFLVDNKFHKFVRE